ncbi:MAG: hypothetical protein ACT4RN_16530 [Pseudonocardia sp.]
MSDVIDAIDDEYREPVEDLRRLAREGLEPPEELSRLRDGISAERARSHREILESVAEQAGVDLASIVDRARRRNAVKRRRVTETLGRLEVAAQARSVELAERFHGIRARYLEDFRRELAARAVRTELKFTDLIGLSTDIQDGRCNAVLGGCSAPDAGSYTTTARIEQDGDRGTWLYAYIDVDTGDCDDTRAGRTLQDLTYARRGPPQSFFVTGVRVDLMANGYAGSVLGDGGWFTDPNPRYEHSYIQLDVSIAQHVAGEWHPWPLVSHRLFSGRGDYVEVIRALLSATVHPAGVLLRGPAAGGGTLLCHVQVQCHAYGNGADARTRIDLSGPDHGIYVAGVALVGDAV